MKDKSSNVKAVMVYMNPDDLVALAEVRRRLGATTKSGAIRAALRVIMHDSPASRGSSVGAVMTKTDIGQVVELMDFLTGDRIPEYLESPSLSREKAFGVIYFLQEYTHVISDNFEMCARCGAIFDTDTGGDTVEVDRYDDDPWYAENGFSRETVAACDGAQFCDPQCEAQYLEDHRVET